MTPLLSVNNLRKVFSKPFSTKKVEAVKGISFEVFPGETFGFLGPNGAGKTTTIKMLTALIRPTGGSATIFGIPIDSPKARERIGFLPENPYVYPYLTPREFVSMCAALSGVPSRLVHSRVEQVIKHVGIFEAIDRPARNLSKGMLQRTGLAAALVHEPEFLILDEPMSGLDPVGRKEVRDLIVQEHRAGRTVMFSSHILSDVELLCDRICILKKGEVVVSGALRDLLKDEIARREVTFSLASEEKRLALLEAVPEIVEDSAKLKGDHLSLEIDGDAPLYKALARAETLSLKVESVAPKRQTLEAIFVSKAL